MCECIDIYVIDKFKPLDEDKRPIDNKLKTKFT